LRRETTRIGGEVVPKRKSGAARDDLSLLRSDSSPSWIFSREKIENEIERKNGGLTCGL